MGEHAKIEIQKAVGLAERVKGALLWRSGSQLAAQLVTWAATFLVIRMLAPSDYGLFAMSQAVLVFLNLMNGYGFANALIRAETVSKREVSQVFGMLILLNGALALAQLAIAPVAAAYFRQPIIADMLRIQALIYICTPFIALPNAMLNRDLNFKATAQVDLIAAIMGAATALACASIGLGLWTLVAAPLVLFTVKAVGMVIAAGGVPWPSFDFRGAGAMFRYGGAMVVVQIFWFLESQADVFIAGRVLSPHELGLYTTALFLTQILAAKFVPTVNEVAFAAYAKIQGERDAFAAAFLKAVRLIMLIAMPFYLGMAATAEPLVLTVLGPKWAETVPLVWLLAFAMPFMTLQILFAPATNAQGRAGLALRVAMAGALILPSSFLVGIQFGIRGMAVAWLVGYPLLTAVTALMSLPAIGARTSELARALMPGLVASAAMMMIVLGLDSLLPPMPVQGRLGILVATGAASYGAFLFLFARPLVEEALALLKPRPAAPAAA